MIALHLHVRLVHQVADHERALLPPELKPLMSPAEAAWVAARAIVEAMQALSAGPVYLLLGREELTDAASIVPGEVGV
jgi:hypothetical protein